MSDKKIWKKTFKNKRVLEKFETPPGGNKLDSNNIKQNDFDKQLKKIKSDLEELKKKFKNLEELFHHSEQINAARNYKLKRNYNLIDKNNG